MLFAHLVAIGILTSMSLAAQPEQATPPKIYGQVVFLDENGHDATKDIAASLVMNIEFYKDYGTDHEYECAQVAYVADDGTFQQGIPSDCRDCKLSLVARWSPEGCKWTQQPLPTRLNPQPGTKECRVRIEIYRPLNLADSERRHMVNLAKRAYEKGDTKSSVVLWREAARGNDLGIAVEAANFFEDHGQQAEEWPVLASLNPEKLNLNDRDRFRLYSRIGHAARAANLPVEALDQYANALKIYPKNRQILSIAYTTLDDNLRHDSFNASSSNPDNPKQKELLDALTNICAVADVGVRSGDQQEANSPDQKMHLLQRKVISVAPIK